MCSLRKAGDLWHCIAGQKGTFCLSDCVWWPKEWAPETSPAERAPDVPPLRRLCRAALAASWRGRPKPLSRAARPPKGAALSCVADALQHTPCSVGSLPLLRSRTDFKHFQQPLTTCTCTHSAQLASVLPLWLVPECGACSPGGRTSRPSVRAGALRARPAAARRTARGPRWRRAGRACGTGRGGSGRRAWGPSAGGGTWRSRRARSRASRARASSPSSSGASQVRRNLGKAAVRVRTSPLSTSCTLR